MFSSITKMVMAASIFAVGLIGSSASHAGIIYSGLRNIVLDHSEYISHGESLSSSTIINLAGDKLNSWDNMQFDLSHDELTTSGGVTSSLFAPAALGLSTLAPYAELYDEGVMPMLNFGSGSTLLWYFTTEGMDQGSFRNTVGYAALMLGDFDGPKYYGWMQIQVDDYQNLNGFGPMITIIDWAFDDTGAVLAMGEGRVAAVPAPAAFVLMSAVLLGLGWSRRKLQLNH